MNFKQAKYRDYTPLFKSLVETHKTPEKVEEQVGKMGMVAGHLKPLLEQFKKAYIPPKPKGRSAPLKPLNSKGGEGGNIPPKPKVRRSAERTKPALGAGQVRRVVRAKPKAEGAKAPKPRTAVRERPKRKYVRRTKK